MYAEGDRNRAERTGTWEGERGGGGTRCSQFGSNLGWFGLVENCEVLIDSARLLVQGNGGRVRRGNSLGGRHCARDSAQCSGDRVQCAVCVLMLVCW